MGKLVQQFMKFGVVGVIAFVIDYGLTVALTELAGVNYLISATISFTVSVVVNYLASMRYVFTHKQGLSRRREFVIFVVLSVIGLGVNDLLMWLGSSVLGVSYLIVKIVATAIVMVYNFVTRKIFLDGLGDKKMRVDYHTQDGRDTHWFTKYSGVRNILYERYIETTNENTKAKLERYIREEPCSACHGARLRPEMLAVTVSDKSIYDVCCLSCRESLEFFEGLELTERQQFIGGRIVKEILERLRFLVDVGLDYLTLDRASATLSGGEAQRIRLATQIGAGLMGVLYILDEPSIGLHQRDNRRLIRSASSRRSSACAT